MEPKQYFDGRVEIRSLPATDRADGRTEIRSRIVVPGGELAVLADGKTPIRHLTCLEFREGKPRGNHYHKFRHEYFYVMTGQVRLLLKEPASSEENTVDLAAGDLVYIAPKIAHAIVPLSSGHGIEFAEQRFDPADVYRYPLA